jgi:hypothetical protein
MMSTNKSPAEKNERGLKILDFQIPEPDFTKSLKEYPDRKKTMDAYIAQSDRDKRVTNKVLDIEFEI